MNLQQIRHFAALAVMLTVGILVAGCGGANAVTPTAAPKETINYQMGWVHEYSSAPFYMAIANGDYAKENLDVNLILGGFNDKGAIDPVQQLVDGTADFSEASILALLQAREQGKPIVAIATLNQRSPYAIISLADKNIVRPQDLVGKTVAVADGG